MSKRYSDEIKAKSIELLLEGKEVDEVSEATGVNRNTLMSWRQQKKNAEGVEFPSHHKGRVEGPHFGKEILQGFFYTDDEVIALARQNPGFGVLRFCKQLYPKRRDFSEVRFLITMLLHEHLEDTGEDLLDSLQDPSFSTLVTENEYKKITGKSRVPQGHGRATGGRSSKASKKFGTGRRGIGENREIPLPPQEFFWGDIPNSEGRKRTYEVLEEE